jgi:hypothetical protein
MFGHGFTAHSQKLKARAGDVLQHAGFEQQIGDAFHGVSSANELRLGFYAEPPPKAIETSKLSFFDFSSRSGIVTRWHERTPANPPAPAFRGSATAAGRGSMAAVAVPHSKKEGAQFYSWILDSWI